MKKIAVILFVLLSLFVFVSCPEPDNEPKTSDVVIKVRNSDLPEGTKSIRIDVQTFGAEYYTYWNVDVSKSDFTVIPLTDEFLEVFKTGKEIEFCVVGIAPGVEDLKGDAIVVHLKYSPNLKTYIIERKDDGESSVGVEGTYEIIIEPQGKFIDEPRYVYFGTDEDDSRGMQTEIGEDGRFHVFITDYNNVPLTYYMRVRGNEHKPLTDVCEVVFTIANDGKPTLLKPTLKSYGIVEVVNLDFSAREGLQNPSIGVNCFSLRDEANPYKVWTLSLIESDIPKRIYMPAGPCRFDFYFDDISKPSFLCDLKEGQKITIEGVKDSSISGGGIRYVIKEIKPSEERTVTIKMDKPTYETVPAYYRMEQNGEGCGQWEMTEYPVDGHVASFKVSGDAAAFDFYIKFFDGDDIIAEKTYTVPLSGTGDIEIKLIAPEEKPISKIIAQPGSYLGKVDEYQLTLNPNGYGRKYFPVKAEETGDTLLTLASEFTDQTEYVFKVVSKSIPGRNYVLAESQGRLGDIRKGNDYVFDSVVPYGRLSLQCNAPFWADTVSYKVKEFADNVITTSADKTIPKYIYLPAGTYNVTDISCEQKNGTKYVNLKTAIEFTLENGKELVVPIEFEDLKDTRDIEFHLSGGNGYTVTLYMNPAVSGYTSFEYDKGSDNFILYNVPDETFQIQVKTDTNETRKFETTEFKDNKIVWDF